MVMYVKHNKNFIAILSLCLESVEPVLKFCGIDDEKFLVILTLYIESVRFVLKFNVAFDMPIPKNVIIDMFNLDIYALYGAHKKVINVR